MSNQDRSLPARGPERMPEIEVQARRAFLQMLERCQADQNSTFLAFEQALLPMMARLGRLLLQLFLACRHERLSIEAYRQQGYRQAHPAASRSLKTVYGKVTYVRKYLVPRQGSGGVHPLDVQLGLTRDGFSPWVIQFVTRLASRMSYQAARRVCKYALGWAPSTEAIEQLVLGLGREAAPYMEQAPALANEGEVLVMEIDGKCTPTATATELSKRRGKRRPRACPCGCQRHRGQCQRLAAGPRKRRKKGDKSKNGREIVLIVMYTLKRGPDGRLHGPINKRIWGSYGGRRAAARWARQEATRRGFGPDSGRVVQIVLDGAKGLKQNLQVLFPEAIFTLDICHVEERLWRVGHAFHAEGSAELAAWIKARQTLLYEGRVAELIDDLKRLLAEVSHTGPGTKGRRQAIQSQINYLEPRLSMMQYARWREQDLVLASGQVEGAVRYVVGERLDGSGMRWIPGRAELLLHLRCIELNSEWETFFQWAHDRNRQRLIQQPSLQIRTNQPLDLKLAA